MYLAHSARRHCQRRDLNFRPVCDRRAFRNDYYSLTNKETSLRVIVDFNAARVEKLDVLSNAYILVDYGAPDRGVRSDSDMRNAAFDVCLDLVDGFVEVGAHNDRAFDPHAAI